MTFTRRAPKKSTGGIPFFGGREGENETKIGDVFLGILAGELPPSGEFDRIDYILLNENKNYEKTRIFGCKSIKEELSPYQIGDRLQVTLTARFTGNKGKAAGKPIVMYEVQCDETYEPTEEILALCDEAVMVQAPAPVQQPIVQQRRPMPQAPVVPVPARRAPVQVQVQPQVSKKPTNDNPFGD